MCWCAWGAGHTIRRGRWGRSVWTRDGGTNGDPRHVSFAHVVLPKPKPTTTPPSVEEEPTPYMTAQALADWQAAELARQKAKKEAEVKEQARIESKQQALEQQYGGRVIYLQQAHDGFARDMAATTGQDLKINVDKWLRDIQQPKEVTTNIERLLNRLQHDIILGRRVAKNLRTAAQHADEATDRLEHELAHIPFRSLPHHVPFK